MLWEEIWDVEGLEQEITKSQNGSKCVKEPQNKPTLILITIKWDKEKPGLVFKIP